MKTLKNHITILSIFSLLAIFSCKTSNDCVCPEYYSPVCGYNGKTYDNPCLAGCDQTGYIDGECPVYGIGLVKYYDTIQNGCGFLIEIFNRNYKPIELWESYQVNDLLVTLKYRRLNDYFTCENPQGHYQEIEILEISSIN
ncbi:MAG: hypothetical protein JW731_13740 [Bacteroidales bacterium]|nr:hypothetical protein [Bacteroidales bacterium]